MHIQSTDLLIEQEKMVSMLSNGDQRSFDASSSKNDELFETSKKSVINSIREAGENMPMQINMREIAENMPL